LNQVRKKHEGGSKGAESRSLHNDRCENMKRDRDDRKLII
jgi:hypothetical protein